MIELTALIIGAITTSLIALIVFAKNNRSVTNRLFLVLTIGLVGWSITTYLSLHTSSDEQTLLWIRWIMFFVVLQNTCLFFLARFFPANQFNLFQKKYIIAIIFSIITAGVAVSPLLFIGFKGSPVPGPGMVVFLPHALVCVGGGLISLIIRSRKAKGLEKAQLQYFLAGTILMFTFEPMGNFIAPVLFKQNQLVTFSPLYSIIFSSLIAYAIIRHRLFDIRLVVARTVAYTLLIGVIGIFYTVASFAATSLLFKTTTTFGQIGLYTVLTLIVAFTFQPLRHLLEEKTDKIFYKGRYDSEELLTNLTKIMAMTLGLKQLTEGLMVRMLPEMRISKGAIVLLEKGKVTDVENAGFDKKTKFVGIDILALLESREVLLADEVNNKKLKTIMDELDVTASVPFKIGEEELGVLLLGNKLSGEIYTDQDIKVLEILAPEISIAIGNAKAYEEIRRFSVHLQEEVKKATADLQIANERLKELDKLKDEFVSIASHELRTPMTAIKSYVWLALNGHAGEMNVKMQSYLTKVYQSSERMIQMINDMLNISRMETGRLQMEIGPTSIYKAADQVISDLSIRAQENGINLKINKEPVLPLVSADAGKLAEIFQNLIGNALKFTPKGGSVTVDAAKKDNMVNVNVSDTGVGISKENITKLFTKFGRVGESYSTVAPVAGTGLGLYITKLYLEKMGGKILVESTFGKGATFTFSLPVATGTKETIQEREVATLAPKNIIK